MYDSTANTRINKVKTSIVFMGITLAFVRLEGNHIRKSHPLSLSIVFQNCNIQVKAVQLDNFSTHLLTVLTTSAIVAFRNE